MKVTPMTHFGTTLAAARRRLVANGVTKTPSAAVQRLRRGRLNFKPSLHHSSEVVVGLFRSILLCKFVCHWHTAGDLCRTIE